MVVDDVVVGAEVVVTLVRVDHILDVVLYDEEVRLVVLSVVDATVDDQVLKVEDTVLATIFEAYVTQCRQWVWTTLLVGHLRSSKSYL